ncbi:MAG: hypothetical protein JWR19_1828 [Pedosphaera sp.]|nr:hypothetical protein [Pedosphaera sp.]
MSIAEQIRGYVDRVEDIPHLENILSEIPLPDLFQALIQLIQSSSFDDVGRADLFIRDVIYRAKINNSEFKEQLVVAGVPAAYGQNVFAKDHGIRGIAVSTLKIFNDWWSAKQIEEAVVFSELNDPILLPQLVSITMFRARWEDWSLPKHLISNPDFLVRWSMLEVLDRILVFPLPDEKILSEVKACLSKLREDVNQSIRAEADFLCNRVDFYEVMPSLLKLDKRKRSKAINQATLKIRFESFRMYVGSALGARRKTDFTMAELHEIAENFQKAK